GFDLFENTHVIADCQWRLPTSPAGHIAILSRPPDNLPVEASHSVRLAGAKQARRAGAGGMRCIPQHPHPVLEGTHMDLSKLPKLSHPPPPPAPPPAGAEEPVPPTPPGVPTTYLPGGRYCTRCGQPIRHQARFCDSCGQPLSIEAAPELEGIGLQAGLSIVVALFLLFMQPRFAKWVLHKLFGTDFAPFVLLDGTTVPYTQVPAFWMDLGPFLFAMVLIIDAIVLALVRRPAAIALTFVLTLAVMLYNLGYVLLTFSQGFAPISFLAAAFGAFMCW